MDVTLNELFLLEPFSLSRINNPLIILVDVCKFEYERKTFYTFCDQDCERVNEIFFSHRSIKKR